jgi:hypothetical protein
VEYLQINRVSHSQEPKGDAAFMHNNQWKQENDAVFSPGD